MGAVSKRKERTVGPIRGTLSPRSRMQRVVFIGVCMGVESRILNPFLSV